MTNDTYSTEIPSMLPKRLQANEGREIFRRRAVLLKIDQNWTLIGCTVEALPSTHVIMQRQTIQRYKYAMLFEEYLSVSECVAFAKDVSQGVIRFENAEVHQSTPSRSWHTKRLPIHNPFLSRAGHIVSIQVSVGQNAAPLWNPLVAFDLPLYPNIFDAVEDWLLLPQYGRESDGRNGQVQFLLPEERAYFSSAQFSGPTQLKMRVAGSEIDKLQLAVRGAYWNTSGINHFGGAINELGTVFEVPASVSRIEYCLVDHLSIIYDTYAETQHSLTKLERAYAVPKDTLVEKIRNAAKDGEGRHIEFKPFVDITKRVSNTQEKKEKWQEIVRTAVAFANTNGGAIYFGINDDCLIIGIGPALHQWASRSPHDGIEPVERYIGVLRSFMKDEIESEIQFQLQHAIVDGALVVVMDISPSIDKPIGKLNDRMVYVRSGANNRSLTVHQLSQYFREAN